MSFQSVKKKKISVCFTQKTTAEDLEYSAVKWSSFTQPGSLNHPLSLRRKQRSLLKISSAFLPKISFCVFRQKENNTETWGSKRQTTSGTRVWEDPIVLYYGLRFTTILFGNNDFDTARNLLKPTKGSGRSRGHADGQGGGGLEWRRQSQRERRKSEARGR